MTTVYLIRHAEAEGNLYRRVHGWYNSLITENGFRQIAALEERFRDIPVDAVYSSDLFRTMTTARAVYVPKGLELHTDPGLREMNLGDWEDLSFGEVRHRFPEEMERFNTSDPTWQAPNGEDFFQMGARIEGAVRRIAARHPGQTVALFSHGMVIRQLIARVKRVPPEQWRGVPHGDNTAVTRLAFNGEQFSLELELDNSHLPESISTLARQAWWRRDGKKAADVNLWFRPVDWPGERELYLQRRRELCPGGDGAAFLREAEQALEHDPWGLTAAMAGEHTVGLLLADREKDREDRAGHVGFLTVFPEYRGRNLGIQLIGQAVSQYREEGRDRLRLPCTQEETSRGYFQKYGFAETAGPDGGAVWEKYVGFDWPVAAPLSPV